MIFLKMIASFKNKYLGYFSFYLTNGCVRFGALQAIPQFSQSTQIERIQPH